MVLVVNVMHRSFVSNHAASRQQLSDFSNKKTTRLNKTSYFCLEFLEYFLALVK